MMIEGLQGTMTGEVAMMTEEALILTMTAAGTTTDAGMIAVGTRGTIATMTGPRGTPTGKADGHAEIGLWFSGFHPFVVVAREMVSRMASWTCPSRRIGSAVWKRSRVSRARRISRDRVLRFLWRSVACLRSLVLFLYKRIRGLAGDWIVSSRRPWPITTQLEASFVGFSVGSNVFPRKGTMLVGV